MLSLFKLEKENEYFVICTLRPDALFGASNLWVSSKIDLVKVKVNGKVWIIAKDALNKVKYQFSEVELIGNVKPQNYIFTPPLKRFENYLTDKTNLGLRDYLIYKGLIP